jgi:hypothetical protein
MTIEELTEIGAHSGLAHARFCLEQEATQVGRDNLKPLFELLEQWEAAEGSRKA